MGKHFDRAEVLFGQGRYELAEKELRAEIAQNPKSADAYALLALCLIDRKKKTNNLIDSMQFLVEHQKKSKEEFELIQYALSLDANNHWYHYILAIYWYRGGDLDRAKKQIEFTISINPNSAQYFHTFACILLDIGSLKYNGMSVQCHGSIELFRSYFIRPYLKPAFVPLKKSLALDPNYLDSLNLLTNLYVTTGRYQQATESSQTALSLDPNNVKAQDLHGQILNACGKYADAIGCFQTALSINPNYTPAKNNLLEAMRSKYYRIYPWISLTHRKGKLVFASLIPMMFISLLLIRQILTGSVNIKTPWENMGFVIICFIMVMGFPAPWIFNYFLIKDKKANFLLTERDTVVANYALSLSVTVLSWIYTCLLPLDSPFRSLTMNLVGITGGILVPPFTFSAMKEVRLPILPFGYQVAVGILGLINLILYFQGYGIKFLTELFGFLVFATIAPAIYNYETTE
jgi:tetratricopeptide (TPR) repeat protein